MKKIILILVLAILPMLSQAQGYHTFVDFHAGSSPSTVGTEFSTGNYRYKNFKPALTFGMNITEGYQVMPNLFAGIGFGGYTNFLSYKEHDSSYYSWTETKFYALYFPLYANVRWTLDRQRKITPFADLKIGYQFGVSLNDGCMTWTSGDQYYVKPRSGIYFVPSVGVRFGKSVGFNLGIAYNTAIGMKFQRQSAASANGRFDTFDSVTSGVFMLTLGVDF